MQTQHHPELNGYSIRYESVYDVAKHAEAGFDAANARGAITSAISDSSWAGRGFPSYPAMLESFRKPWSEGVSTVRTMMEKVARELPAPKTRKRQRRWSDVAGEIDVDRAMQGEPEFMSEVSRHPNRAPPTITLLVNVGGTSSVTAEQMFWRGAAAVAVVDALEGAGYSCEIWAWNRAHSVYGSGEAFSYLPLKEAGESIDLDRLANGVSTWFFRKCMIYNRALTGNGRPYSYGNGSSQPVIGRWRDLIETNKDIACYEMGVSTTQWGAINDAKALLAKIIEEGGAE